MQCEYNYGVLFLIKLYTISNLNINMECFINYAVHYKQFEDNYQDFFLN